MKLNLMAPVVKRLKLKYDEVLSTFAFNLNLRRYTLGAALLGMAPPLHNSGRVI
jgi:hypothetical protein